MILNKLLSRKSLKRNLYEESIFNNIIKKNDVIIHWPVLNTFIVRSNNGNYNCSVFSSACNIIKINCG